MNKTMLGRGGLPSESSRDEMRYRLGDLLLPPAWLSWSRLPLAACFALFVEQPFVALGVLIAAGLSDVLDGWLARRYGLVTATGAALDPITDKLFVLTVAVTLVASGHLSVGAVLLLSTREIGELPLVMWFAWSPAARAARAAAVWDQVDVLLSWVFVACWVRPTEHESVAVPADDCAQHIRLERNQRARSLPGKSALRTAPRAANAPLASLRASFRDGRIKFAVLETVPGTRNAIPRA